MSFLLLVNESPHFLSLEEDRGEPQFIIKCTGEGPPLVETRSGSGRMSRLLRIMLATLLICNSVNMSCFPRDFFGCLALAKEKLTYSFCFLSKLPQDLHLRLHFVIVAPNWQPENLHLGRHVCRTKLPPKKLSNRYEKRFEKREQRSEKRSETCLKNF